MNLPTSALGAILLTSLPLSAATLVKYDFEVSTTAVGEFAAGVSAAPLGVPSDFVRTTNNPESGAGSLAITFSNLNAGDPPASGAAAPDNVTFTVSSTAGQLLQLQSLTFLTGMSGNQATGAVYSVQYDLGAGFLNIGSNFSHTADASETRTVDLSDPIFSGVSSISFRINITEPAVSTNGGTASARIDDISLNGSVIPEPSSFVLLAAAGLFAVGRRSRP
ncbi:MAG: PEP-CTERM sorting domain-containing protein [Verrucomicrobiaceae bacterium]|nr:MAG: PEP-CTERM sorting domain-containing protein [Verrucomicrobiaceae bacterium]